MALEEAGQNEGVMTVCKGGVKRKFAGKGRVKTDIREVQGKLGGLEC
jgi:hypothetical protein